MFKYIVLFCIRKRLYLTLCSIPPMQFLMTATLLGNRATDSMYHTSWNAKSQGMVIAKFLKILPNSGRLS